MTRDKIQDLLCIVQAAYPNFNVGNKTVTVDTWFKVFENYDYSVVEGALYAFILSDIKGFAPSIGQIMEKIQTTTKPQAPTEMEAWSLLLPAIGRGNYYAKEEFEKLPPLIQKAVGSPDQIAKWAAIPSEELHTVGQSNFMRSYRAVVARESEQAKLPLHLRQISAPVVEAIETKAEPEVSSDNVPMPEDFLSKLNGLLAK